MVTAETVNCFKIIFFVLKFTEPKAEVNYSKIFIRVGIVVVLLSRAKRLSPAPVFFLRLRLVELLIIRTAFFWVINSFCNADRPMFLTTHTTLP